MKVMIIKVFETKVRLASEQLPHCLMISHLKTKIRFYCIEFEITWAAIFHCLDFYNFTWAAIWRGVLPMLSCALTASARFCWKVLSSSSRSSFKHFP